MKKGNRPIMLPNEHSVDHRHTPDDTTNDQTDYIIIILYTYISKQPVPKRNKEYEYKKNKALKGTQYPCNTSK